jgi:SAM-dependent methyltransferase
MERRQSSTATLVANGQVVAHRSPFGLPTGLRGRLAGWYMGLPDRQHRELIDLVPMARDASILEIGFGPGQVLAALHRREPSLRLGGVDPSQVMVAMARRRNPAAHLRVGAAAEVPFPDGWADVVVIVNNLPLWPDLDAGLDEVRRVASPSGQVLAAWHGGWRPRGHQRALVLDPTRLAEIDAAFARHFPGGTRRALQHSDLWAAGGP